MTMSKKAEGSSRKKLGWWLGAPMRALSRACDSYVRRMTACAGRMPTTHAAVAYGGRGGFAPAMSMEADTFSSRSRRGGGDDELNALLRALSQRHQAAYGGGGEADVAVATVLPPRSRSVAVGRIDEDAPCEFGAHDDIVAVRVGGGGGPAVRRARSVAVGRPPRPPAPAGGYKKQLGEGVVLRG